VVGPRIQSCILREERESLLSTEGGSTGVIELMLKVEWILLGAQGSE
jgi:hypothetical protein